jgi:hypothetical protein
MNLCTCHMYAHISLSPDYLSPIDIDVSVSYLSIDF